VRRIGDTVFARASPAAFTRTAGSYAFFGVPAGIAGGTITLAIARARKGKGRDGSPR
jgi:hypothetical protein